MVEMSCQKKIGLSVFFIIQIMLLIWVGWQNQDQINPDAVSYIRIAQYYATGQFDLMISGYWGPLLSWIIAPLLGFVEDPLSAAHLAMGFSAIIYLLGCVAIFRVLGIESSAMLLAVGIIILFSVRWSVRYITPDLLMSGILCLAISRIMIPDWCEKASVPFFAGVLFGAAYLAKAVALPLAFGLTVAAGLLWMICQKISLAHALRNAAITFLGLMFIAGPWIIILSLKYERLVFSTSAEINHAIVGPSNGYDHPTFTIFHIPEKGRITSWEDPSVLSYSNWSPLKNPQNLRHQVNLIKSNMSKIVGYLQNFDWLGIGLVAVIFGFLFHVPWRQNLQSDRWRWAAIIVGCLVGIYLPVAAKPERYYFAAYPFLLGGSMGFVGSLVRERYNETNFLHSVAVMLVAVSFLLSIARSPSPTPRLAYQAAKILSQKLKSLEIYGPIASTQGRGKIAFYTAYLMGVPFYGVNQAAQSMEDIESSSAKTIIVERGNLIDSQLKNDENFISLDEGLFDSLKEKLESEVTVYINTNIMLPKQDMTLGRPMVYGTGELSDTNSQIWPPWSGRNGGFEPLTRAIKMP